LIGVPKPDPSVPDESQNSYVFEKRVTGRNGHTKFIDCYRRGHFILENKQGATLEPALALSSEKTSHLRSRKTGHGKRGTRGWDVAMEKARKQAENYARLLDGPEIAGGRPPFLLVADVGHSIAVYADWSRAGGHYQPFPDPNNYRIPITELHREELRERLRLIWTDPLALDPSRRSARVTKQIADRLARLAKSLEDSPSPLTPLQGRGEQRAVASPLSTAAAGEGAPGDRQGPGVRAIKQQGEIAKFLMRCLFTMFAEDAGLLPEKAFTELLRKTRRQPAGFVPNLEALWQTMNTGGFSIVLNATVRRFNGGLFADCSALPLDEDQIQLLIEAAEADWREVEPAIFGTLLERALDPRERHSLGAHYTPRAYVERLVQPTILEPLRREWESVQTAALARAEDDKTEEAIAEVERFLQRLADLRVLDPACGSGNFLYVTLELLKRLEGEVRNTLQDLGQGQISIGLTGATITPENMLGIELNPRAAAIAELVLWIGYLQWHLRSTGGVSDLGEPIIRDYHNIENRDAILSWERTEPLLDKDGKPVTRWDGVTYKIHPVTGQEVPDEGARSQVQSFIGAKKAEWPEADFIVGNPPFIGEKRMRDLLGDGYTESVRTVYNKLPAVDFVMYWWHKAAEATVNRKTNIFGLITTNSIVQTKNRKVVEIGLSQGVVIAFAIPDHPWVDNQDGASVRIAMSVGTLQQIEGHLAEVVEEVNLDNYEAKISIAQSIGYINSTLNIGPDVASAIKLLSNKGMVFQGVKIGGSGFLIDDNLKKYWIGNNSNYEQHLPKLVAGTDLAKRRKNRYCIDLYGNSIEEVREKFPEAYQHLKSNVYPIRQNSRREAYRDNWWIFMEPRSTMRSGLKGIPKYIATVETSKHRYFSLLPTDYTIADGSLAIVVSDDPYHLGILSSKVHVLWALAQGGTLEDRPRWQNGPCFETFPFPTPTDSQKQTIRELAERLDAHRKRQQALHPKLTMTGMYNVLEQVRAGEPLSDKERKVYEQGLVGILRQLHDELDAAVLEAYGWEDLIRVSDEPHAALRGASDEVLQRLVDLNAERAAEEARGLVRWLRPDYQAPEEQQGSQGNLGLTSPLSPGEGPGVRVEKRKWPAKDLTKQVTTLRDLLREAGETPLPLSAIATAFKPKLSAKRQAEVEKLLEMMASLGQAELTEAGWRA
jgi:hypothetical protein